MSTDSNTRTLSTRTPDLIAAEIESIKGQTRHAILQNSVEIGRRLVEVKALLPHGEWGPWLEGAVDYSQSTANNLMAIYREYGGKLDTLGNLTYSKALALLGMPDEEKEQFVAQHDVEAMSSRELKRALAEKAEIEDRLRAAQRAIEQERADARLRAQQITQLEHDLEAAERAGDGHESRRLQSELDAAMEHLQALECEQQQRPVDVAAIVEKIPPDIEAELADLRRRVARGPSEAAVKFGVCFETLVRSFQDVLAVLPTIEELSLQEKYRNALCGLLTKMDEKVKG